LESGRTLTSVPLSVPEIRWYSVPKQADSTVTPGGPREPDPMPGLSARVPVWPTTARREAVLGFGKPGATESAADLFSYNLSPKGCRWLAFYGAAKS